MYNSRLTLLSKACQRGWERDRRGGRGLCRRRTPGWLPDYALFMACKRHFGIRSWTDVGREDIRLRRPEAAGAVPVGCCGRTWSCSPTCNICFSGSGTLCGPTPPDRTSRSSATCPSMWPWTPPMCGRSRSISSWTTRLRPHGGGRGAAGLLLRRRPAVGQPPVQLGRHEGRRLRLVDPPRRRRRGKLYDVIRIDHFRGFEQLLGRALRGDDRQERPVGQGPGHGLCCGVLTGWFPQHGLHRRGSGLPDAGGPQPCGTRPVCRA